MSTLPDSYNLLGLCLSLGLSAAACGSGGGDDTVSADAGVSSADAVAAADADPADYCVALAGSYPDLGSLAGTAVVEPIDEEEPAGPVYVTLSLPLNTDATPDTLRIELWDTNSPFKNGFATGSYSLSGLQSDLFECGTCVYIAADFAAGEKLKFHMASGGMLTIDELDPTPGTGRIRGSLSSVSLREVMVAQTGQTNVVDGCVTSVEALSFDVVPMAP